MKFTKLSLLALVLDHSVSLKLEAVQED